MLGKKIKAKPVKTDKAKKFVSYKVVIFKTLKSLTKSILIKKQIPTHIEKINNFTLANIYILPI